MKNRHWNLVFVLGVLSLLALSCLPAFGQTGTLDVKCVDSGGNPVSGVKVSMQPFAVGKPKEKKSDGKGIADFGKSDDGVYRIIGRKEGFAPALYEFVQLKGGDKQSVTLKMQPGDPLQKLYFEDPAGTGAKVQETYQQAVEALKENKFADAENKFKAMIELNPSFPLAYLYLASALLQQQKWDQGEEALKKAAGISAIMMSLPAKDPAQTSTYAEIQKQSENQLAKLPALKLESEGRAAFQQKQYDVAAAKFQEAIKLEGNDAGLYSNLAVALANIRKFEEADRAIDQALKLIPGERTLLETKTKIADMHQMERLGKANTILSEGDNLYKGQDFAGALKKYEEALPLITGPKQAIVYAAQARCHVGLNNFAKAVESYRKAMEVAPEETGYRTALANYYLKEKKYEEALNLYADQGATGQADQALFNLGQSLSKQGNGEVAALAFEKCIKANPANAEAYYELGMLLYYDKKNDPRARELLEKYVQLGKNADHVSNTNNVLIVLKRRMSK